MPDTTMVDVLLTLQDSFIQSYINDSSACSTPLLPRHASSHFEQVASGKSIREIATPATSKDWQSKIGHGEWLGVGIGADLFHSRNQQRLDIHVSP